MSTRKHKRKLTRNRHTGTEISEKIFHKLDKYNHAVRDVPFHYGAYHAVMENLRAFAEKSNLVLAYQIIVFAQDNESADEMSFTVQRLRIPTYKQDDGEMWKKYNDKADDILNKSSEDYLIRFMRFILLTEKTEKITLERRRQINRGKQAIGKAEAKRERDLQAEEKRKADIRHKREENAKLRAEGKLKPAQKKPHTPRKVW